MNGMEILLKSMGINLEDFQKEAQNALEVLKQAGQTLDRLDARLSRIEQKLGIDENAVPPSNGLLEDHTNVQA